MNLVYEIDPLVGKSVRHIVDVLCDTDYMQWHRLRDREIEVWLLVAIITFWTKGGNDIDKMQSSIINDIDDGIQAEYAVLRINALKHLTPVDQYPIAIRVRELIMDLYATRPFEILSAGVSRTSNFLSLEIRGI